MDDTDTLRRRGRWLGHAAWALSRTWTVRQLGQDAVTAAEASGPVLYAFWHGEQLPLLPVHSPRVSGRAISGMASRSADGTLLVGVLDALGYGAIRGSTSRGGAMGLRGCIRAVRAGTSVGLAVDGPRGPRHQAQPGIGALAAHTGRPVVCLTAVSAPAATVGSWDRFVLPAPFARITVCGAVVPASRDAEAVRAAVERALLGLPQMVQTTRERN